MNDQEILKRIAEIEGATPEVEYIYTREVDMHTGEQVVYERRFYVNSLGEGWNPLTNWSDLGPLIEKYTPTMEDPAKTGFWRVCIRGFPYKWIEHESLPHAILLAIIEAHA